MQCHGRAFHNDSAYSPLNNDSLLDEILAPQVPYDIHLHTVIDLGRSLLPGLAEQFPSR